jgi:hypothetical protein
MRLPRVRFTVRRIIMLVTTSAMGFAALSYHRNASHYREIARFHSRQSIVHDFASKGQDVILVGCPTDGGDGGYCVRTPQAKTEAERARMRRIARYHAELTTKYERAAARPWLPIESDPPLPE